MFYVTFPNREEADAVSKAIVTAKLAACANVHSIRSHYHWQEQLQNDDEWVAIIKTSHANKGKVESKLEELHSYEVPCILHWEFQCNFAYEKWLRSNIVE